MSSSSGQLYVVATPIGNLSDISSRALEVLRRVALIAAEDTRVTAKLLAHYGIATRMLALHEHNEAREAIKLIEHLRQGEDVALVSDAGTPGLSDPGAVLVRAVQQAGIRVTPVPGPSALAAALSVCGFAAKPVTFYGFLPQKKSARELLLRQARDLPHISVFYEAPHRIVAFAEELVNTLGAQREVLLGRELTKLFESLHRCLLGELPDWLKQDENNTRGEFVLVVDAVSEAPADDVQATLDRTLQPLLAELPLSQAVQLAVRITGLARNKVYERALRLQSSVAD